MLLGALLLFFPVPQTADTTKIAADQSVVVSYNVASENPVSTAAGRSATTSTTALPTAPEAKVKTDAELAAEPAPAAFPIQPVAREPYETPRKRKIWFALTAVSGAGGAFDAWSTRRAISGGFGTESNPLLRPFVHSNALYAATQVSPLVLDYVGRRMMRSEHGMVRKMWWLPQSAGATVSFVAGAHNVGVAH
jgi:hypothetical protein